MLRILMIRPLLVLDISEDDFNLTHSKWVNDSYKKFYNKHGYLPQFLDVYNSIEIKDYACTQSTRSNGAMGSGTILIICENRKST